ncbi:hypothetical protein BDU57DRAFT_261895 [Ampelomyces quisqualis]|uniref:Uncharacterized protein n=1 Tax=Ampelomyces quisqualis TaxID=50730 RepID=A0A6A5QK59_AMPQU|nr:hypothetical protein BDU57DRAFT_261895 [Ampelomyces quisqualis]
MTVETAYDLDDVMGEIPTLASESLVMDGEVLFPLVQSPTAGPSGRYRDPQSDDSVSSSSTARAESCFEFEQAAPEIHIGTDPPVPIESCCDVSIPLSSNIDLARLAFSQTKKLRSELFKLLLRHLNNIDQFSSESFEPEAKDRLNHLLNHFWLHDTEIICARLGDRFTQRHTAMSMRHARSDFQHTTGYSGNPGDDWKAHLRRMDRVSRARASIAYVGLQSCVRSRGDVDERFNDHVAIVFDTMTQVDGCTGVEEFSAVEVYNEGLYVWFSRVRHARNSTT